MQPPLTLNLVGAGRVGLTLASLWQQRPESPLRLQAVANRSEARRAQARVWLGEALPVVAELAQLPAADIWLLAVPDTRIAQVAAELAALPVAQARGAGGAAPMVWHCSGFQTAAELAPLQALGWQAASVHPAMSFAEVGGASQQFPGTICALEGDEPAVALARSAFSAIGGQCFDLAAADKPLYHGAAVFASNFLPVLTSVAQELWHSSGVPPELVAQLTGRFVRLSVNNVLALGPQAALTGPAARGDMAVLQAQSAAMSARDAQLGAAYAVLSELAGRLAREGHVIGAPESGRA